MPPRPPSLLLLAVTVAAALPGASGCGSRACDRWDYDVTRSGAPSARAALDAYLPAAPGDPPRSGWKERGTDAARSFTVGSHWRIGVQQLPGGGWYVSNASSC